MEKLAKLKEEIKQWEYAFKKAHGKGPSKEDVKADHDMDKKYKEYRQLKKGSSTGPQTPRKRKAEPEPQPENQEEDEEDKQDEEKGHEEVFAVGPTPQLKGRAMGLFDAIQDTPTKSSPIAQTPTKKRVIETPKKSKVASPVKTPISAETPAYFKEKSVSFSPLAPRRAKHGLSTLISELREMQQDTTDDKQEVDENVEAVELDHIGEEQVDSNNPFDEESAKYKKRGAKRTTKKHNFKARINDQDIANGAEPPKLPKNKAHDNFRRLKLNNSGFKTNRSVFKRR